MPWPAFPGCAPASCSFFPLTLFQVLTGLRCHKQSGSFHPQTWPHPSLITAFGDSRDAQCTSHGTEHNWACLPSILGNPIFPTPGPKDSVGANPSLRLANQSTAFLSDWFKDGDVTQAGPLRFNLGMWVEPLFALESLGR